MKIISHKTIFFLFLLFCVILPYISSASTSDACVKDEDCAEMNYCNMTRNKCEHKKIFTDPISEMIGLMAILFGSALSNAGGIGGGGLLIPILLLILKFYTHEAIPISKLMIFTGALTSFSLGFRQKHPFRNSITIDYNIPLLLVPMLLFGTMVGVTLNKVTPPWLILVSLTLVLTVNTYKTLTKAKKLHQQERTMLGVPELNDTRNVEELSNSKNKANHLEFYRLDEEATSSSIHGEDLLKLEELKDKRKFPFNKIIFMIISYIVMLLISFLKGSDYMKSIIGVEICTAEYWVIYFLYFPFALLLTYIACIKINKEYHYRLQIGYPYNPSDIKWDRSIFIKFPTYAFISGLMAGLLGIGGGLILGPLLLELGLHPLVSTATSNFLVLFTSSSTSIQFILLGMMNLDFGIACTIASSVGSYIGTVIIQKIIQKTKRNSYIIFALGAVLGISTLLIPAHTFMNILNQIKEGKSIWSFNKPC